MRMWNVNPKLMCRQHLLGEHLEMHMFTGVLKKKSINSLKGYIDNGLVDVNNIFNRHMELVKEMERRGYKHKSNLFDIFWFNSNVCGKVDNKANLIELSKRCLECRRLQNDL